MLTGCLGSRYISHDLRCLNVCLRATEGAAWGPQQEAHSSAIHHFAKTENYTEKELPYVQFITSRHKDLVGEILQALSLQLYSRVTSRLRRGYPVS